MTDVVDLVSDEENGDDAPGPTRAELKPSACSYEEEWFSQLFCSPDDQVINSAIPEEHLRKFKDLIWHKPHDRMVPGYGMTPKELASVSSEGRRGWLVSSHFYWLSRCINSQQTHTKFHVFDPTIRAASIEKLLLGKDSSQIKQIVFVLSVGRQDDGRVFLGTDKVPGDHWSMAVVDIHTGVMTYCDTLGWPYPYKFLSVVVRYTSVLGLTEETQITVRLAHKPNQEQHVCVDSCTNYPLQTCSDVCGIITMVCIAIAALDKNLFELLLKPQQAYVYLTDPTQYSTYLRHVVLYWLSSNHIDMTRISLKKGFNALAAPPADKNKRNLKRKVDMDSNGLGKVVTTPSKQKMSRTRSNVNINDYILEAVEDRIDPSQLVQEVVEVFAPEARKSLESLNREMRECYEDIFFNEMIERERDDCLSLKSHVRDLIDCPSANPVIIFKNQGKDMKTLQKEDVILAIQTPFQREMMRDYGKKCVCVDLTRQRDNDKFHLYTVLVFVEGEVEVPVAWLLSNRSDNLILSLFFKTLKLNIGSLETEIFIGDMASTFYKQWSLQFPKPAKRMFPVWEMFHVLSNRLNSFINNDEPRSKIKSYLSVIPLITNVKACQYYTSALLEMLEPYPDFREYFKERYVNDSKIEFWASCYRVIPSSKFIPFLRSFDKTLQHLSLHGSGHPFTRVDVLLHKLLQLARYLEFKVQIQTSETRLLKAAKMMNIKHASSPQGLDIYTTASGDSWFIRASADTNSYFVVDTGLTDCQCGILCTKCKFCVHRYMCSCPTYLLNPGGCEHIHCVYSFLKLNEALGNNSSLSRPSLFSSTSSDKSSSSSPGQKKTLGAELNTERLKRQIEKDLTSLAQRLHGIEDADELQKLSGDLKALLPPEPSWSGNGL